MALFAHIAKGATKVQNLHGVNTTRKKFWKNTTEIQKKYHYFLKICQIFEKTLPKCKKPILENTTRFLEKHYRNAKNATNIIPCRSEPSGDISPVSPVLTALIVFLHFREQFVRACLGPPNRMLKEWKLKCTKLS